MIKFTDIIPCTEENKLAYELAYRFSASEAFGVRKDAVSRARHFKEYTTTCYSALLDFPEFQRLAKLSPDSDQYYKFLVKHLNWGEAWMIEDFWQWTEKRFHPLSFLLKPFMPLFLYALNYLLDTECTKKDWNDALRLVYAIDIFRLAGERVVIDLGDRSEELSPI